jgi:proline dehydrogenase
MINTEKRFLYTEIFSESMKDTLYSIQAPGCFVQFLHRSPLILCIISRHQVNLKVKLDIIYNQVISILSKTMLKNAFDKMGHNFDLRRWFDGIDKRVHTCFRT